MPEFIKLCVSCSSSFQNFVFFLEVFFETLFIIALKNDLDILFDFLLTLQSLFHRLSAACRNSRLVVEDAISVFYYVNTCAMYSTCVLLSLLYNIADKKISGQENTFA